MAEQDSAVKHLYTCQDNVPCKETASAHKGISFKSRNLFLKIFLRLSQMQVILFSKILWSRG